MNDYTYKDMMRMQSDAKQRVLEMQKRSKSFVDDFNEKNQASERKEDNGNDMLPRKAKSISYPTEIKAVHSAKTPSLRSGSVADIRGLLKNVFGNITGGDSEKLFIMALCLLLADENTDDALIIALMYLLT